MEGVRGGRQGTLSHPTQKKAEKLHFVMVDDCKIIKEDELVFYKEHTVERKTGRTIFFFFSKLQVYSTRVNYV